MAEKACGSFSIVDRQVQGPAEYMRDPQGFDAVYASVLAGTSAVFNYAMGQPKADVETALLVAVQTHYAGWRGQQSLRRSVAL